MSLPSAGKRMSLLEPIIALFVGLIIVSNIISQKVVQINVFGLSLSSDVGTLLIFPLSYIFSDILTEVYGYAVSRRIVWYGFGVNILAALIFSAAVAMPFYGPQFDQKSFSAVLGQVPALVVASMAGYWLGSFTNDSIIAGMKVWMVKWDPHHRWLPLRTIASTIGGELVDTSFFVGVGTLLGVFYASDCLSLILTQWVIKSLVEIVLTPATVIVIGLMKRHEQVDMVGTETWNPFAIGKSGGENYFGKTK